MKNYYTYFPWAEEWFMRGRDFWKDLRQLLLELHCVMERHLFYKVKKGYKCARCGKRIR
jgi:hypothetical protein